jgi:hypothetical protein
VGSTQVQVGGFPPAYDTCPDNVAVPLGTPQKAVSSEIGLGEVNRAVQLSHKLARS